MSKSSKGKLKKRTPPPHMVEWFDKAENYIHRFMIESFTINMYMCGLSNEVNLDDSVWSHRRKDLKKHIAGLKRDMRRYSTVIDKQLTLYRGTTDASPTMKPFNVDMQTCSFVSCTTSKKVASEFTMKKGFIHIFNCHPGVVVTDFKDHYATAQDKVAKQEKEVVLHPKMCLHLNRRKDHCLYWDVKPKSKKRKR